MIKYKFGFTISEMLIALAIVGILGVVLSPIMRKIMPDQNKVMIKRSFYELTNIVSSMLDDDGLYSIFGAVGTTFDTRPKYAGFDNKSTVSYNGKTFGGDSKFRGIFVEKLGTRNYVTGTYTVSFKKTSSKEVSVSGNGTRAVTKDGIKWTLVDPDSSSKGVASYVLVDVNGDKAPNCYEGSSACAGRTKDFDQYTVAVYNDGRIKISYSDNWVKNIFSVASSFNME